MVGQIGDGRIAPRIAFALVRGQAQFAPDVLVQIIGGGFGGLHRQAVAEIGLAVFVLQPAGGRSARVASCPTVTTWKATTSIMPESTGAK